MRFEFIILKIASINMLNNSSSVNHLRAWDIVSAARRFSNYTNRYTCATDEFLIIELNYFNAAS